MVQTVPLRPVVLTVGLMVNVSMDNAVVRHGGLELLAMSQCVIMVVQNTELA